MRVRQLPNGSYVEIDKNGRLLYRERDGKLITEVVRWSMDYVSLGLRPHTDGTDRALVNEYDLTTIEDPYALVWNNRALRYMTREESLRHTMSLEGPPLDLMLRWKAALERLRSFLRRLGATRSQCR